MRLLGAALSQPSPRRSAWPGCTWTTATVERCEAHEEDCEGLVNYALAIEGIEVALFFREQPDGTLPREPAQQGCGQRGRVAASFRGGGHECASGCAMPGPLSVATERHAGPIPDSRLRAARCTSHRQENGSKHCETEPAILEERTRRSTDLICALIAFCGFLFFAGLQVIGLLGADEPRYAQIAREMLRATTG